MSDADSQQRERELAERIASRMRSIGQGPEKPVSTEEQQKLKAAASRLGQMLKAAADAENLALKDAAARLDKMLADIAKGKDITDRIKRRNSKS